MSVLAATQLQQQAPPTWDSASSPRFQTLKFLGKGGQGFVQLAYDNLHHQRVAIKYIDRGWSRGFYKYVLRETLNHQQLSLCKHPHIVEFHEVFLTPSYLAVVMEYVNGTNLQHYLEAAGGKLPEDVARFIFQQLVIAVDFCHKKGKVNRDIKLANILLQEGHLPLVKLCDFGFSKDKFDDSEPQTQIGTALFTAPEIFTNVAGQVYDAEAADVWSCGVVLFVMLFGCHPFLSLEDTQHRKHAQVMKLIENAVRGNVQVPAGAEELYPQALDLVRRILVSAPGQRCKLPAIMSHPWFQEKLPPGALLLNAAYLAMENPVGELRQTPEEVHAIITAALSVSAQEPELSEGTSNAAAGMAVEATSASETSRCFPQHQQHQPTPSSQAHQHPHQQPLASQGSGVGLMQPAPMATAMAPQPQGMQSGSNPAATVAPLSQLHHLPHALAPGPMPSGMVPQPQPQAQPQSGMAGGFLGTQHPMAPSVMPHPQSQAAGLELLAAQGMQHQHQPGSAHVSCSSHPTVAVACGASGSGPAPLASGPGPGAEHVQASFANPSPVVTAQPTGILQPCMTQGGSPMHAGHAGGGTDAVSIALSSGNVNSGGGPAVTALQANPPDPSEVASAAAGGPGAGVGAPGGMPHAMDVSGCILYDSSLLYKLDLQTED